MAKIKEVKKISRIAVVEREQGKAAKNLISQACRVISSNTINDNVNSAKVTLLDKAEEKLKQLVKHETNLMVKFVECKSSEQQVSIYQDIMQVQSEIESVNLTKEAIVNVAKFLLEEIDFTETEE